MIEINQVNIKLSGIGLTELPRDLSQITSLKQLDISYNNFCTIPPFLDQLKQLEYLSMEGNFITVVTSSRNKDIFPSSLSILNLSYNLIDTISSCIFEQLPS